MKLVFDRVETRCRGRVTVDIEHTDGIAVSWTVVNDSGRAAAVESIALVWRVVDARPPLRMFRHGYQSWSPSGWATFAEDDDPSRAAGAIPLVMDMHHADPSPAEAGELRSELVTALVDDSDDPPLVVGFLGGSEHDGSLWLRRRGDGVEVRAEAYLGGIELDRGDVRQLHSLDGWQIDEDIRRPLG